MSSCRELLINEFNEQKKHLSSAKRIVLYGNSIVSCMLRVSVKELGFNQECEVFDKGKYLQENISSLDSKELVVIACSSRKETRKSMFADSKQYFPESPVFDFFAIYYSWITNVVKRDCDPSIFAETLCKCREGDCIHNIDSINTLYCNLRCKECSNGIQYRKEKKIITPESQTKHLKCLTDKMPICQCNFQGGEVFTDVHFVDFIKMHAQNPGVGIFTIATNGTILPKDEVFKVIKETGCMIRISDYGPISIKKEAILEKCREFDIPCFTFPFAEKWRRFGEYKKRNRSENELREIRDNCCFGTHDMMFVDNKLFCCLRTLFADAIKDENDATIANTLDLDKDFTREDLESFVRGDNLWKMCDYCAYPMDVIEPAEQLPKGKL